MSQPQTSSMSLADDDDEPPYGSSEPEHKQGSSGPRKRASRAGTRSVNSLTSAQLERKRQNDRDAQRAIRKRTKDHIETLERENTDLTTKVETLERVNTALETRSRNAEARNRQLTQENEYLKSRLGYEGFGMRMQNAEVMSKPVESVPTSQASQASPELRFASQEMTRPSPKAVRPSLSVSVSDYARKPETWRQLSQSSVFESANSSTGSPMREDLQRSSSWKGEIANNAQDHTQHNEEYQHRPLSASAMGEQRSGWNKEAGYGYMMDMRSQQAPFGPDNKANTFSVNQPVGPYSMHMAMAGNQPQYGTELSTAPNEYTNMPMQRTPGQDQMHDQQPYNMPMAHMQHSTDYHGDPPDQRHDSLQRTSMSSSYSQAPASGTYPQPNMEYHDNTNPAAYQYGQYRPQH